MRLSTPVIPDSIRRFSHPTYTNIYELCPSETRLYGTESLYGDWASPLLLLAKDFAPACLVRKRIKSGDPRPFHHTDWRTEPRAGGAATNRNLDRVINPAPSTGLASLPCPLYGSALAGLLRNDCKLRGPLPDFEPGGAVRQFAADVLHFTMRHMPRLRVIVGLGEDAWDCATVALDHADADWRDHLKSRRPLEVGAVKLFAFTHPAYVVPADAGYTFASLWHVVRRELSDCS